MLERPPNSGWAKPPRAMCAHYFVEGSTYSACGGYWFNRCFLPLRSAIEFARHCKGCRTIGEKHAEMLKQLPEAPHA